MTKCWQIELTFPDRKIKTFVYSDNEKSIEDRFREDLCAVKVLGEIDDPLSESRPTTRKEEAHT
jgi:hypothetical protein